MTDKHYYGGLIWTDHVLKRLVERGLTQNLASQTFHRPDKIIRDNANGSIEYQKRLQKSLITVIAKQNDRKQWLILSCWVNPPVPGTKDAKRRQNYYRYQKASFWGKVGWLILKWLKLVDY